MRGTARRLRRTFPAPIPAPLLVSGLQLWLKADRPPAIDVGTANRSSTWGDSSGNGRAALQPTAFSRPLWITQVLNNRPVLRCDGLDDSYLVADNAVFDLAAGESNTLFVVVKSNTANKTLVCKRDDANNGWSLAHAATGEAVFVVDAGASPASLTGTTTITGAWHILTVGRDADGATARLRVDGPTEATGTQSGDVSNAVALVLGAGMHVGNPSLWASCDFAELVYFKPELGLTDLNLIGNYLADKYALPWTDQ